MWDIRESLRFTQQCDELGIGIRRIDELRLGVDWVVHTAVDQTEAVPHTNLRIVRTRAFPGAPAVRVYLSIENDHLVTYEWIELVQEDPDEPLV